MLEHHCGTSIDMVSIWGSASRQGIIHPSRLKLKGGFFFCDNTNAITATISVEKLIMTIIASNVVTLQHPIPSMIDWKVVTTTGC